MFDQPVLGQQHRIDTDADRFGTRRRPVPSSPQRKVFVAIAVLMIAIAACATDDLPQTLQADLVVATGPVLVGQQEIGTGGGAMIELGSQITLGAGARGFLTVRDLGRFEMYKQAAILLESWEPAQATAFLDAGHVTFTGEEGSDSRLILETSSSSSVTTLEPATRFTACQPASGDTCVAVQKGSVELTSAGVSETYEEREGTSTEAAFLTRGEPPEPAICLPTSEFDAWFDKARNNEESPALGMLVGAYPACDADAATVNVPGTEDWTDAGIDLAVGDNFEIKAGGGVTHAPGGASVGPDGDPDPSLRQFNVAGMEQVDHAALIGRIGEAGTPFLVGRLFESDVVEEGRLFLGINDADVSTNGGEYFAVITLVSRP